MSMIRNSSPLVRLPGWDAPSGLKMVWWSLVDAVPSKLSSSPALGHAVVRSLLPLTSSTRTGFRYTSVLLTGVHAPINRCAPVKRTRCWRNRPTRSGSSPSLYLKAEVVCSCRVPAELGRRSGCGRCLRARRCILDDPATRFFSSVRPLPDRCSNGSRPAIGGSARAGTKLVPGPPSFAPSDPTRRPVAARGTLHRSPLVGWQNGYSSRDR